MKNPFEQYTAEYKNWFKENEIIFQSELLALKQLIADGKIGVGIGVGGGIFAEKLNIKFGLNPSENMLKLARQRNLTVTQGFAENLIFPDKSFDFAAFLTSICFVNDPDKVLSEAHRISKDQGNLIISFIDKESASGQLLEQEKANSRFYK